MSVVDVPKWRLIAVASSASIDTFLAKGLLLVAFDLSDSGTVEHDSRRATAYLNSQFWVANQG